MLTRGVELTLVNFHFAIGALIARFALTRVGVDAIDTLTVDTRASLTFVDVDLAVVACGISHEFYLNNLLC